MLYNQLHTQYIRHSKWKHSYVCMEAQGHEHLAVSVWYTGHSANIHIINRSTVCLLVREIERNVRQRSLEDTWLSLPCVWYKLIIIIQQTIILTETALDLFF